jgi:hypothetical protein
VPLPTIFDDQWRTLKFKKPQYLLNFMNISEPTRTTADAIRNYRSGAAISALFSFSGGIIGKCTEIVEDKTPA